MKPERVSKANGATLRWSAAILAAVTGIISFYYGDTYAGFYENLWYVMGGIYVFAAILLAANEMPHLVQPTVFGYAIFLLVLWAVGAISTGAGLDIIAYLDKGIEVILVVNLVILIRNFRTCMNWG